jgi:hypothetical protein
MKKFSVVFGALFAGWLFVSPYVTSYQLKSAADARDGEKLSKHIEFPLLRQNIKEQVKASMARDIARDLEDNPFSAIGTAFGSMMIDGMIDALVTPANITQMMKGEDSDVSVVKQDSGEAEKTDAFDGAKLSYEAWDMFSISVPSDDGDVAKFILQRQGLGWKLINIVIPM